MIFIKIAIALLLLAWVFISGEWHKIDYSIYFSSYITWGQAFLYYSISFIICIYRWKTIIEIKSENKQNYLNMASISWIGSFFNGFLPGSYGGDFIKVFYINKDKNMGIAYLISTAITDRLIGLIGHIFLFTIFTTYCFFTDNESNNYSLLYKINFSIALTLFLALSSLYMFSKFNLKTKLLNKITNVFHIKDFLSSVFIIIDEKNIFLKGVAISIISQFFSMLSFWVIVSPFLNANISFAKFTAFISLGFLSMLVPITPQGIGVGHVTFDFLFKYLGQQNGAFLYNLFFLMTYFYSFLGLIPYLLKKSDKDTPRCKLPFQTNDGHKQELA